MLPRPWRNTYKSKSSMGFIRDFDCSHEGADSIAGFRTLIICALKLLSYFMQFLSNANRHAHAGYHPKLIQNTHIFFSPMKKGITGSFSRVRCNCRSNEHIVTKLAIDNTLIEALVSLFILIFLCERWYSPVKVYQ